jgi:endonuclease YncB( thermonuclease family)
VRGWIALALALALAVALLFSLRQGGGAAGTGIVSYVRDGDTIELEGGDVVRLVQIDTPELREHECYAVRARALLRTLLPVGTKVRVVEDPGLDHVDRYGRRLAYVFKGKENVNRALVAGGAGSVWFYDGRRGRYASQLLGAARRARATRRGLWGRCLHTRLDPTAAVDSVR